MDVIVVAGLFVAGAVMGSFACCQAWRWRLSETRRKQREVVGSWWSACMSCGYRLEWYDNVPVVSWLVLKGKCRKCGKKIGGWEIGSEVGMGLVFVLVFLLWPFGAEDWDCCGGGEVMNYGVMAVFLAMMVGMGVLFVADARWGRLPVRYLTYCVICATVMAATREWGGFDMSRIWDYLGVLAVLPGLYYFLYRVSAERWVGGGDWLLALPMAVVLGDFWLGFSCLFLANLMGCLVMVPVMRLRKRRAGMRIPFGPFLIVGFLVVFLFQGWILSLI